MSGWKSPLAKNPAFFSSFGGKLLALTTEPMLEARLEVEVEARSTYFALV